MLHVVLPDERPCLIGGVWVWRAVCGRATAGDPRDPVTWALIFPDITRVCLDCTTRT